MPVCRAIFDLMSLSEDSTSSRAGWLLTLYIAGKQSPKSLAAYSNLKRICEEHLLGQYRLQLVDLHENPDAAQSDNVLAVPTLVRNAPGPVRRIIGDLSDVDRVLTSLNLPRPGGFSA